jgi:hypothetical protein
MSSPEETLSRAAGHVYLTSLPSMFIVAHVDYVRVVPVLPVMPEEYAIKQLHDWIRLRLDAWARDPTAAP